MPRLYFKDFPPALREKLEEQAKLNQRSLNDEIIAQLEIGLNLRREAKKDRNQAENEK